MKRAVIDIGTNSVKLYLAKYSGQDLCTVLDLNRIVKLGAGLQQTGYLSEAAMTRCINTVSEFVQIAKNHGACTTLAVGTMAFRAAQNSREFISRIHGTAGIHVTVLSGDEEARLSYLAAVSGLNQNNDEIAVIDIGGGSTEFIFGIGEKIRKQISLNLGVLSIRETYFMNDPPNHDDTIQAQYEINKAFTAAGIGQEVSLLAGVGGTATTMAAVKHELKKYDPGAIQGSSLTISEVNAQINLYSAKTLEERKNIFGLQPERADLILAGACILRGAMEILGRNSLIISDRGLRHGLMLELLSQNGTR